MTPAWLQLAGGFPHFLMDAWVSRFADSRYRHERASASVEMQPLLRPWHNAIPSWLTGRLSKRDAKGRKTSIDGRRRLATITLRHTRRERTPPGECRISCGERERRPGMEEDGECSLVVWTYVWQNETEWREWRGDEVLMRLDEHESVWYRAINKSVGRQWWSEERYWLLSWGWLFIVWISIFFCCISFLYRSDAKIRG